MKYKHHKYTWTSRVGSIYHSWEFVGPIGALSFNVSISSDNKWGPTAGLEFHHTPAAHYNDGKAPDHIDCRLTGGPCWHDGTSLYAMETVWPLVERYLTIGDHPTIFKILEHEADRHFDKLNKESEFD